MPPKSSTPYLELPKYARAALPGFPIESARLVEWANKRFASSIKGGLSYDSCWHITAEGLPETVCYQSKFDVDSDGLSANSTDKNAPYYDKCANKSTSLKQADGKPFDSPNFPFLVLPSMTDSYNTSAFADRTNDAIDLKLGDLAVCLWSTIRYGPRMCAAIYVDMGPMFKIGEGSIDLAIKLGINPDPNNGGYQGVTPGVVHIAFPGSRKLDAKGRNLRTAGEVQADAMALLKGLCGGVK